MDAYELISPKSGKPCGIFVCGKCNLVSTQSLVDRCCQPCDCGKPSRNRFEAKCKDCYEIEYRERREKQLEKAELVEWDGSTMIFSEWVSGYNDGWFDSPEDLLDYLADEDLDDIPEFAFLGKKCVRKLDISRALEWMTEDTYEEAELKVNSDDMNALMAAVEAFNSKYALTYFTHDYSKKIRVLPKKHVTND